MPHTNFHANRALTDEEDEEVGARELGGDEDEALRNVIKAITGSNTQLAGSMDRLSLMLAKQKTPVVNVAPPKVEAPWRELTVKIVRDEHGDLASLILQRN